MSVSHRAGEPERAVQQEVCPLTSEETGNGRAPAAVNSKGNRKLFGITKSRQSLPPVHKGPMPPLQNIQVTTKRLSVRTHVPSTLELLPAIHMSQEHEAPQHATSVNRSGLPVVGDDGVSPHTSDEYSISNPSRPRRRGMARGESGTTTSCEIPPRSGTRSMSSADKPLVDVSTPLKRGTNEDYDYFRLFDEMASSTSRRQRGSLAVQAVRPVVVASSNPSSDSVLAFTGYVLPRKAAQSELADGAMLASASTARHPLAGKDDEAEAKDEPASTALVTLSDDVKMLQKLWSPSDDIDVTPPLKADTPPTDRSTTQSVTATIAAPLTQEVQLTPLRPTLPSGAKGAAQRVTTLALLEEPNVPFTRVKSPLQVARADKKEERASAAVKSNQDKAEKADQVHFASFLSNLNKETDAAASDETNSDVASLHRAAAFDDYVMLMTQFDFDLPDTTEPIGENEKLPASMKKLIPPTPPSATKTEAKTPRAAFSRSQVQAAFKNIQRQQKRSRAVNTHARVAEYITFTPSVPPPAPQPDGRGDCVQDEDYKPFDFTTLHNWRLSDARWVASPLGDI